MFAAARHEEAQHFALSENPNEWLRAAEVEPSNADNWDRLGRYWQLNVDQADLPLAISYYRRATRIDPSSATYWIDLAGALETSGDTAGAEQALVTAQRAYPISSEVAWRLGNFYLRHDRVADGFAQIHSAISADPTLTQLATSTCWASTQDIDRILNLVLPNNPDAYWGAITFFVRAGNAAPAMAIWRRLAADRTAFSVEKSFPLIDALLNEGRAMDAQTVWRDSLGAAGIKAPSPADGSILWNGGFEEQPLNGGFDWRYQPTEGVKTSLEEGDAHGGDRTLRIVFDGTSNVDFANLWQWVAVQPNTKYRFRAYIRSMDLTTDNGVRFAIMDASHPQDASGFTPVPTQYTPNVVGTQPWALDEAEFTSGPMTNLLRIVLLRQASSMLANKISGTAWVDDVSLVPVSGGDTSR